METEFVLLALLLILIFSLRGCLKQVRYGCCGSAGKVRKVRPSDRKQGDFPWVYEVQVEDMKCRNCAVKLENAFHEREGYFAKASLQKKCVKVSAGKKVPEEELRRIVRKSGYSAGRVTLIALGQKQKDT